MDFIKSMKCMLMHKELLKNNFLLSQFTFRFAPIIGQFKISDIATMSFLLNQIYGKIVKVGGLMGRPDLLFVYDADEIEKVII
jgi:hypothetical protein